MTSCSAKPASAAAETEITEEARGEAGDAVGAPTGAGEMTEAIARIAADGTTTVIETESIAEEEQEGITKQSGAADGAVARPTARTRPATPTPTTTILPKNASTACETAAGVSPAAAAAVQG